MALGNIASTINGVVKNLIVALDGSGNVAVGHVQVNSSGVEVATAAVPLVVSGGVAVGGVPVNPPLSVAGVDQVGNKQHLRTDTLGRVVTADIGSAPFQGVVSMTPGTPITAQRSFGFICTTAGTITLTLANASMITLPIAINGGAFQVLPFAATNVTLAGGAAGTFWGLV